jgi:hypothetical protein
MMSILFKKTAEIIKLNSFALIRFFLSGMIDGDDGSRVQPPKCPSMFTRGKSKPSQSSKFHLCATLISFSQNGKGTYQSITPNPCF